MMMSILFVPVPSAPGVNRSSAAASPPAPAQGQTTALRMPMVDRQEEHERPRLHHLSASAKPNGKTAVLMDVRLGGEHDFVRPQRPPAPPTMSPSLQFPSPQLSTPPPPPSQPPHRTSPCVRPCTPASAPPVPIPAPSLPSRPRTRIFVGDRRVERDGNHLLSLFRARGGEVHGAVLRSVVEYDHSDSLDGDAAVVVVRQGRKLKEEQAATACGYSMPFCHKDGYCSTSACGRWTSGCSFSGSGCASPSCRSLSQCIGP